MITEFLKFLDSWLVLLEPNFNLGFHYIWSKYNTHLCSNLQVNQHLSPWLICVLNHLQLALLYMQGNRHVLATDEWLRVKGYEDAYAIGDCATIDQRKIMVCEVFNYLIIILDAVSSLVHLSCNLSYYCWLSF
jgi:hypothetical protein